MPERLRFGVIGTGAIGLQHLNSLLQCPRATAVAVAETHAGRAREACDRYRISRSYSDYRQLLEQPDLDAVTVALPNHLHAEVVIAALQARKHVLTESPLAFSTKEAQRVLEAARKARCSLMVSMPLRFQPPVQAARAAVARGDLGEVYYARAWWRRRQGIPRIGSWFTRKALAGGGCLLDLGAHVLDLCLHLLGEWEARSVSAHTAARFGPRGVGEMDWGRSDVDPGRPFEVEDFGVALLRLKGGCTVVLESTWAAYVPADGPEYGVELLGTEGGLTLFPARLHRPGRSGYECVELAASATAAGEDRIHHFVASVVEARKPPVAPEESLRLQRLVEAMYASSKSGQELRLD